MTIQKIGQKQIGFKNPIVIHDFIAYTKEMITFQRRNTVNCITRFADTPDLRLMSTGYLILLSRKVLSIARITSKKTIILYKKELNVLPHNLKVIDDSTTFSKFDPLSISRKLLTVESLHTKEVTLDYTLPDTTTGTCKWIGYFKNTGANAELIDSCIETNNKSLIKIIKSIKILHVTFSYSGIMNYLSSSPSITERKQLISFTNTMTHDKQIIESFADYFRNSMKTALFHFNGVTHDYDNEFLHDFRVTIRKLRSVLDICKPVLSENTYKELSDFLKYTVKTTNKMRDMDVYIENKKYYCSLLPDEIENSLDPFFNNLQLKRLNSFTSYKHLIPEIKNKLIYWSEYNFLSAGNQGAESSQSTLHYAKLQIFSQYLTISRKKEVMNNNPSDEDLHSVRIEVKKLRYCIDFFMPLFNKQLAAYFTNELKELQTFFGEFNDYSIQQNYFTNESKKMIHRKDELSQIHAISYITVFLISKKNSVKKGIIKSFKRFIDKDTEDKLKQML